MKVLQDKLEKIRIKQMKKREQKLKIKLQKTPNINESLKENINLVSREVIIRLKPFTEASKDFIMKERNRNCNMQSKITVQIPAPIGNSKVDLLKNHP